MGETNVDKKNLDNEEINKALTLEIPDKNIHNDLKAEHKNNSQKIIDRSFIKNVNNQVLIDILSPEIGNNEKTKRHHKSVLIIFLTLFLVMQLYFVYNISNGVIEYATSEKSNQEIVNSLLAFVTGYITSVIIELIAILNYVIKNVFDTSVIELVKLFKDTVNN